MFRWSQRERKYFFYSVSNSAIAFVRVERLNVDKAWCNIITLPGITVDPSKTSPQSIYVRVCHEDPTSISPLSVKSCTPSTVLRLIHTKIRGRQRYRPCRETRATKEREERKTSYSCTSMLSFTRYALSYEKIIIILALHVTCPFPMGNVNSRRQGSLNKYCHSCHTNF